MNLSDDAERAIEKLRITTSAETDKHILNDAFIAFEKSAFQKSPKSGHDVRPNIFHNRIVKIATVAAAVVIIFAIFFSRDVKTDPRKIYDSLTKADNLCILSYLAGETQPDQRIWKSQNLALLQVTEDDDEKFTLWDFSKKIKMNKFLSSNSIKSDPITERDMSILEVTTIQPFGSFADVEKTWEIFQWIRIDDSNIRAIIPGSIVFETVPIMETTSSVGVYRKWRVFIDIKTNLPLRTEVYVGPAPQGSFELVNFFIYTYPEAEEIEAIAKKAFDPAYRQPERPRPIGTPGMQ